VKDPGNMQIIQAITPDQLDDVRGMVRAFIAWHRNRHPEDISFTNKYFASKLVEDELAALPGKYAKPDGSLLVCYYDNEPAGCVALRKIDNESCEMKRMFVYERLHGKGIGRALAIAIIDEARSIGYRLMRLDTSFRQREALQLYESVGFKKIKPYYELPKELEDWLVFMELRLNT
jgi:GNAT superfamily N-acetyltransferase